MNVLFLDKITFHALNQMGEKNHLDHTQCPKIILVALCPLLVTRTLASCIFWMNHCADLHASVYTDKTLQVVLRFPRKCFFSLDLSAHSKPTVPWE